MRTSLARAGDEVETLETNIRAVDRQLTTLARARADLILWRTVPGVGLRTAPALVALVGDIRRVPSGRPFASVLGLTPKADSSAWRRRLGAISQQGEGDLRMRLIHGARSVLLRANGAGQPTAFQAWARATPHRRGHHIAAVAVANTLARIVWAVWTRQAPCTAEPRPITRVMASTTALQEDCTELN